MQIFDYISSLYPTVEINLPTGYKIGTPSKLIEKKIDGDRVNYFFESNEINFAIAKYNEVILSAGTFYVFDRIKNKLDKLDEVIKKTHQIMSNLYGYVDIIEKYLYVSIPNGFGSFARDNCVFCEENGFFVENRMNVMIHEYIHLGWNVEAESKTQRIRFFDEAFTQYFVLRVLEYFDIEKSKSTLEEYKFNYRDIIGKYENMLVPIADFGKYEYGYLNYYIGPIFLYELESRLTREVFDRITKGFLEEYRNIKVTLNDFCNYYIRESNDELLRDFLNKWIYTTEEIRKYI